MIRKVSGYVLRHEPVKADNSELYLTFSGQKAIQRLNQRYFFRNISTDVIAFPITRANNIPGLTVLGDIFICPAVVRRNAGVFKTSFLYELCFCVAHGILHVLGYEDRTLRGRREMFSKQAQALTDLGILKSKK